VLTFDVEEKRFNFRSVAVIVHDEYVLIHKSADNDFWALPGGRVEFFDL
jgi:8-oxo-dGTP pyrophosphatase MutT (NUDIX family)